MSDPDGPVPAAATLPPLPPPAEGPPWPTRAAETARVLPVYAAALAALSIAATVVHGTTTEPSDTPVGIATLFNGLLVLAVAAVVVARPRPGWWTEPAGAVLTLMALGCAHVPWDGLTETQQTAGVALVVLASSMFFLSSPWFGAMVATALAGSAILAYDRRDDIAGDDLVYAAYLLVAAAVLAVAIHLVRVRTSRRLLDLRRRVEDRDNRLRAVFEIDRRSLVTLEDQYRELARSRSHLGAIVEATVEAVMLADPDGRVLIANRRFADMFGLSTTPRGDDADGRSPQQLMSRVLDEPGGARAQLVPPDDQTTRATTILRQRWPRERHVRLSTLPVQDERGQHIGRLYLLRDVSDEWQIEHFTTDLVARLSRDLGGPLTSIAGYLDMLDEGIHGPLSDAQARDIGVARENTDRLVALVSDLVDISRVRSARLGQNVQPVDLGRLVTNLTTAMRPTLATGGRDVALDVPRGLPTAMADPEQIAHALRSAFTDARNRTPPAGTITVTARGVGDRVEVDVHDVGPGGSGTDLARALIEAQGGDTRVVTSPGIGSTFSFSLPAAEVRAGRDRASSGAAGLALVASDDQQVLDLLREAFASPGHGALAATSADEAFELAWLEHPQLVVVDVMLDGLHGIDLVRSLRDDPRTSAVPAVPLCVLPGRGDGRMVTVVHLTPMPVAPEALLAQIDPAGAGGGRTVVLVAEGDEHRRQAMADVLRSAGASVHEAPDRTRASEVAQRFPPDLTVVSTQLPDAPGLRLVDDLLHAPATAATAVTVLVAPSATHPHPLPPLPPPGLARLPRRPIDVRELVAAVAPTAVTHG